MRQGGSASPDHSGAEHSGVDRESAVTPGADAFEQTRLITIGGGKGGVGKTFLTANLGAAIAREGFSVVVVDGDLEGANLHTCLGVPPPPISLADFAAQREEDVAKLAVDSSIPNLRLIAATRANLATPQPAHFQRVKLMSGLRRLGADFVIVDLGAGTASAIMDYFVVGDDELVVIAPEPTSVENAYAFLRAAFYRRMRLEMQSSSVRRLITQALDPGNERGIQTPLDLIREIDALDSEEGNRFVSSMRGFRPRIVMNGVRTSDDIKVGFSVRSVCRKYFGIEAEYIGYVNHDEAVHRSVLARRPLVLSDPRSDASIYLARIARKICQRASAENQAS